MQHNFKRGAKEDLFLLLFEFICFTLVLGAKGTKKGYYYELGALTGLNLHCGRFRVYCHWSMDKSTFCIDCGNVD